MTPISPSSLVVAARFVEQDDLRLVDRVAQRRRPRPGRIVVGEPLPDHVHLRRSETDVKEAALRKAAPVEVEVGGEHRLPAQLHDPKTREVFAAVERPGERAKNARDRVVDRDRLPRQEIGKAAQAVARERVGADRSPGEQGPEDVGDRSAEARRGEQRQPVFGADGEPGHELPDVVQDVSVALDHPLGSSGRTRREEHVREVLRRDGEGRGPAPARPAAISSTDQAGTPSPTRRRARSRPASSVTTAAASSSRPMASRRADRKPWIERHVEAAGLESTEHRREERRARVENQYDGARPILQPAGQRGAPRAGRRRSALRRSSRAPARARPGDRGRLERSFRSARRWTVRSRSSRREPPLRGRIGKDPPGCARTSSSRLVSAVDRLKTARRTPRRPDRARAGPDPKPSIPRRGRRRRRRRSRRST